MSRLLRFGAACAVVMLLAGCAGVPAGKAGGGLTPETVVLAVAEADATPVGDAAEAFAEALTALSDGTLTVRVRFRAHLEDDAGDPSTQNDYDGVPYDEVARQLIDGEVELAALPDFAWAEAGAPGIVALKAPLVIDSDALMFRVAEELGTQTIDDLREVGVEPLVLLPESIRHPVSFDTPLRTVADFDGRSLRVTDPFVGEVLRALGADPKRIEGGFARAVAAGSITGAESAFVQIGSLPRTGIYTSDIALGAKFNVIAAGGDWFSGLSNRQQEWIATAAGAAFEHTKASHHTDAAAAASYCDVGGWVVHAQSGTAEDIRTLVSPIVARVEASAGAGGILQKIRTLKADLPAPTPPPECTPTVVEAPPVTEPRNESTTFPDGTYRARLTVDDFVSVGVDPVTARNHAQVWTLTFRDGQVLDIGCGGSTYTVTGDRISVVLGTEGAACGDIPGQELFSARWSIVDDGALRFTDFGPATQGPASQTFNDTLWGAHDWIRVR